MALAAAAGNPVWVLCVTNGDQGGRPGEMGVDHSLDPEIRLEELRCACSEMGIAEPIFLGYRDSGMEGWGAPEGSLALADPDEVVERMVEVIRRLRPAVIVTFDPGGIYGHPDHVKCSATATAAYRQAAAEPGGPIALYHQVMPRSRIAGMRAAMEEERRRSGDTTPPSEDDLRQQEAFERLARPDEEITTIVRDRRGARSQARRAGLPRQPDARPALGRSRRSGAGWRRCSGTRRSCGSIRRPSPASARDLPIGPGLGQPVTGPLRWRRGSAVADAACRAAQENGRVRRSIPRRPDRRAGGRRSSRRANFGSRRTAAAWPSPPKPPGARQIFLMPRPRRLPRAADRHREVGVGSAVVAGRPPHRLRPRRGDLDDRRRGLASGPGHAASRPATAPRDGAPTAIRSAFISRRRGWDQLWVVDAPVPRRGRPATRPRSAEPTPADAPRASTSTTSSGRRTAARSPSRRSDCRTC